MNSLAGQTQSSGETLGQFPSLPLAQQQLDRANKSSLSAKAPIFAGTSIRSSLYRSSDRKLDRYGAEFVAARIPGPLSEVNEEA